MDIVVGSQNPAKLDAVREAFARLYPTTACHVVGVQVPPGPPPYTERNVRAGARHRMHQARMARPHADFWVGVEAGVQPASQGPWFMVAWIAVEDAAGRISEARAGTFPLPPAVIHALRAGKTVEEALAQTLLEEDSHRRRHGLVGVLSSGLLSRRDLYVQGVLLALLPWRRPELW